MLSRRHLNQSSTKTHFLTVAFQLVGMKPNLVIVTREDSQIFSYKSPQLPYLPICPGKGTFTVRWTVSSWNSNFGTDHTFSAVGEVGVSSAPLQPLPPPPTALFLKMVVWSVRFQISWASRSFAIHVCWNRKTFCEALYRDENRIEDLIFMDVTRTIRDPLWKSSWYQIREYFERTQSSTKQRALCCVIPRPDRLWPRGPVHAT